MRKPVFLLALVLLSACAHEEPVSVASNACRTAMPLELRARRINERLAHAYVYAPPLSATEAEQMAHLAECGGAAALGVGDGCQAEWAAARENGLAERYRVSSGRYSIPRLVASAAGKPLGANRTRDLLTALAVAHAAEREIAAVAGHHIDGPQAMMLVASDVEQAMICDSADLAMGRRVGMTYDANATVPPGP